MQLIKIRWTANNSKKVKNPLPASLTLPTSTFSLRKFRGNTDKLFDAIDEYLTSTYHAVPTEYEVPDLIEECWAKLEEKGKAGESSSSKEKNGDAGDGKKRRGRPKKVTT